MRLSPWRSQRDLDLDDEIREHLRMAIRDRIERGESLAEAEAAARREFGNVSLTKEVTRDMWGWTSLDRLVQDLRYACRVLAKRPASTLAAIVTLALAIGANVAIFSIVDRVVLHPLAIPDAPRLVALQEHSRILGRDFVSQAMHYDEYQAARRSTATLETVAASGYAGSMAVVFGDQAGWVRGLYVSPNYFRTLGLSPQFGRDLQTADDAEGATVVAVISDQAWRTRLGGRSDSLGRTITINGVDVLVVGVGPKGFVDVQLGVDPPEVFVPLHAVERLLAPNNYFGLPGSVANGFSTHSWLNLIGRLNPGVRPAQAQAELASVTATSTRRGSSLSVVPLDSVALPALSQVDLRAFATLLWVSVGLVLLVGCTNFASLLLLRVDERRAELAVRSALGASRGRLMRQLTVETSVLVGLGGTAALLVAFWIDRALADFELPGRVRIGALRGEDTARVVAFTVIVTVLTALVCGLIPVLRSSKAPLVEDLKRRAGSLSAQLAGTRALVAAQTALCLVLMFGAALFLHSLASAFATSLGFDPRGLVSATINPNPRMEWDQARLRADAMLARVRALPGVERAAIGEPLLRSAGSSTPRVRVDGRDQQLELDAAVTMICVSPDYFATLRQPLLAGHDFTAANGADTQTVAIVNESAARRFWPDRSAVDHTIGFQPLKADARVIGVVGDVKRSVLKETGRSIVYLTLAQNADAFAPAIIARSVGSSEDIAGTIQRAIRAFDPDVPLYGLETIGDRLDTMLMPQRLGAALIGLLAVTALGLTAVGIYGVVARLVARSVKEIGIRMALGAAAGEIVSMMAVRNVVPVAGGLVAGSAAALWAGRFADRFMYGIRGSDLTTLGLACAVLLVVAVVAAIIPALRALRVNPVDVLRAE